MKTESKKLNKWARVALIHKSLIVVVGSESPVGVPGVETVSLHSIREVEMWRGDWDREKKPTVAFISKSIFKNPFAEQFLRRASIVINKPTVRI